MIDFFKERIKGPTTDGVATGTTIPSQAPTQVSMDSKGFNYGERRGAFDAAQQQVSKPMRLKHILDYLGLDLHHPDLNADKSEAERAISNQNDDLIVWMLSDSEAAIFMADRYEPYQIYSVNEQDAHALVRLLAGNGGAADDFFFVKGTKAELDKLFDERQAQTAKIDLSPRSTEV